MYVNESRVLNVCVPTLNRTCQLLLNIWLVCSSPVLRAKPSRVSFFINRWLLQDGRSWNIDENCWFRAQFRVKAAAAVSAASAACKDSSGESTREVNFLFWQINTQRCKCIIFEKANENSCGSFSKQVWCSSLFSKMPVILQLNCQMDWKLRKKW